MSKNKHCGLLWRENGVYFSGGRFQFATLALRKLPLRPSVRHLTNSARSQPTLPRPQGEGWGEGVWKANPLIFHSPHPGFLPGGEGTYIEIDVGWVIASLVSERIV
jgi:hypothetical protein